ncbi:MAG TPA: alginate export family protein [Candidatus Hydrogenedentes bacterium]|nr:alginate export family protein [Candidatus Hydrogenedentota bacterium]
MRTMKMIVLAALVLTLGGIATAELQNVEVGGKLHIRGNYWSLDDGQDQEISFYEQRTQLNVKADFTDNVTAFVELDSYDIWGEDFRSNYFTGADGRQASTDDVEFYQAYIEAREMWGTPLMMRVGRQELVFGSEFLLGNNDTEALFRGLSFDAIRLAYVTDTFRVDAFTAKLADTIISDFASDDIDLYGIYGSYMGIEDVVIDAYWLYVRDDEVLLGDNVDIHTVGLRGAGKMGGFDFDVEVAYQFGEVDGQPSACPFGFGEADVDYQAWAVSADLGYTFDVAWQPRVSALFAWYDGGDPDESCWSNDRELPFNRLFSDKEYSYFLDNVGAANLSNIFVYGLAVEAMPTEAVSLKLAGKYFDADEDYGTDGDLGWELSLVGKYNYTEDLAFRAGYAHFFATADDNDVQVVDNNGLTNIGIADDDDYDYVFAEMMISF